MTDVSGTDRNDEDRFADKVGGKAARKLQAQATPADGWRGLGLMGIVGWSVVVPTLLGVALGIWLDGQYPNGRSWTLALLIAGLVLGCFNAWYWVSREEKSMRDKVGPHE